MSSGFVTIEASNTAGNIRITGLAENGYTNLSGLVLDVSNLSPSAEVLNEKIEKDSYNDKVIIDANGVSGTSYPSGTYQYPVNNLTDAITIAENLGIYKFEVVGDLTMSISTTYGYHFIGQTGGEILTFIGATYPQSKFENFYVSGDLGGVLTRFESCRMIGVTNFVGSL